MVEKHRRFLLGGFAILLGVIAGANCASYTPTISEPPLDGGTLGVRWTFEAAGPINSVPVRVGDIIAISPIDGPLVGLSVTDGTVQWEYAPTVRLWERSVVTDGQYLFVGIAGGRLVALNAASGQLVWERQLGTEVQTAPVVADDVLYVPTTFVGPGTTNDPTGRAKLFALATETGEEIWTFESDNYILQTPAIHGNVIYAGGSFSNPAVDVEEGGHTRIYALTAQDGSPQWQFEAQDGYVKALYATEDVVAFIAYADFASGIDAATGELLWRRDTGNWVPSLAGQDNVIYFGSANTVVHAWDIHTGDVVWEHNIPGGTFNYALGAPVVVEGHVYLLTQRGDILALNEADGSLLWSYPAALTSREGLTASGGWIFVGDQDGKVVGFSSTAQ